MVFYCIFSHKKCYFLKELLLLHTQCTWQCIHHLINLKKWIVSHSIFNFLKLIKIYHLQLTTEHIIIFILRKFQQCFFLRLSENSETSPSRFQEDLYVLSSLILQYTLINILHSIRHFLYKIWILQSDFVFLINFCCCYLLYCVTYYILSLPDTSAYSVF